MRKMDLECWRSRVSTEKGIKRVQIELHTELHFTKDMIKRKIEYVGYVLRDSRDLSHLQILEGRVDGKNKVDCPTRIWMKDICERPGLGIYEKVKRAAED